MILANDNVTVGIVNQATMFLAEEHEVCIGSALDKYEVSMQHGEDDEYEHHEVVDDAHRHSATNKSGTCCEEGPLRGGYPQAKTRVSHPRGTPTRSTTSSPRA